MALRITKDNAKALGPAVEALVGAEKARPSKYKNHPTVYNGVRFSSKAEAAYAAKLDADKLAGVVKFWVGQPVFRLGCPENVYRSDFIVVPTRDDVYVVEIKGCWTLKAKRDRRLWAKYGPCDLLIVTRGKTEVVTPEHLENKGK